MTKAWPGKHNTDVKANSLAQQFIIVSDPKSLY